MKQAKPKKRIFVAVLLLVLSLPLGAIGQNGNFTHQSFGSDYTGSFTHQSFGSNYTGSFTHQSYGSDYTGGFTHQSFGSNYEGFFTHQSFGGDAPLGSGLLILIAAGAGYAASKRKKQQINKEN